MSYPVFDIENKLVFVLQVMSKTKRNSSLYAGFSNFDEAFLGVVAKFL
jgi:hypothetical protein